MIPERPLRHAPIVLGPLELQRSAAKRLSFTRLWQRIGMPRGRFLAIVAQRGFDCPLRVLPPFPEHSKRRFAIRFKRKQQVFATGLAGRPGHLSAHLGSVSLQKGNAIPISVQVRVIEVAGKVWWR